MKNNFEKISQILPRAFGGSSQKVMVAANVCYESQKIIEKKLPKIGNIDSLWKVLYFKNQTLTIGVTNSVVACEINTAKDELIKEISQKIKNAKIAVFIANQNGFSMSG